MTRFYLVPAIIVTSPATGAQSRQVKYEVPGLNTVSMDYGLEPLFLVAADVTDNAQHTVLAGNSDVYSFATALDQALGSAPSRTLGDYLEARNLPGQKIQPPHTYRQVLRVLVGIFRIAQRYSELALAAGAEPNWLSGVTLNTKLGQAPLAWTQRLFATIDSLGYDRSTIDAQSSLRDVMFAIGQQQSPLTFFGLSL